MSAKPLSKGMQRIYRKGRRALAEARSRRTPEALHEWRKAYEKVPGDVKTVLVFED